MNKVGLSRLILLSITVVYLLLLLFPAIKSVPGVPSEKLLIPVWLLGILAFRPSIFFTKEFLVASIFLIVHLFYIIINNYQYLNPRTTQTQAELFIGLFFSLSFWIYLFKENDIKYINIVFKIILVSVLVTGITSILGAIKNPYAVRHLIGNQNQAMVQGLLRQNVGGYTFQFMVALIAPLFVYVRHITKNKLWYIPFVVGSLCVVFAQIVGVILVHLFNFISILIIMRSPSFKKYISFVFVVLVFSFFSTEIISSSLYFLSDQLSSFEQIQGKFFELAHIIENSGEISKEVTANSQGYAERNDESINAFFKSPLVGGTGESGGHHFWIDNLAEHGILGTLPWLLAFIIFMNRIKRNFLKKDYLVMQNILIVFFIIGLTKNILIYSMPLYLFFFAPLILLKIRIDERKS